IGAGDELLAAPSLRPARVRGIQALKEQAERVSGVARVALNLRGVAPAALARGTALGTPGAWALTAAGEVRLGGPAAGARPPRELVLHIGTARTTARVRVLGGAAARLALDRPLPLHVGDRVLLRMPGAVPQPTAGASRPSWPAVTGATVLDVAPPPLRGRGAAAAAGGELESWPAVPGAAGPLRRPRLAGPGGLTGVPWGCPRARRRSRGTGWPTRRTGRRCAAAWRTWPPRTPPGTRWRQGCRWTRPAPRWGWPTAAWSRRWPRGS